MTREEAIEILKTHHMWTGKPQEIIDVRKENKALDMAIKALSQEPCDNAISRSDTLDAIGHGTTYTSEELQRIIQNLPPVNPKPCDDVEQIDYHDDFATALKKMQDYEKQQTEKNCDTCINKDKCSPNIREIVRKNGCPKWTPKQTEQQTCEDKDIYEPLLPIGKYPKTSFPCDSEDDVKQTKQEPCDDAISREEVIECLNDKQMELDGYGDTASAMEIARVRMTINDLPSVTQKSNIKALGEELRKVRGGIKNGKVLYGYNMAIAVCNKHFEEDAEQKSGKWIADRCDMYICSKCNHIYTDLSGERYGMNFCPNCGAKMESEDKTE